MKRLIAGFLGFSLIIPSLASAQTIDELRAQINSLLAIVAQLQTQLQTQTGNSNDSFCYTFNNDLGVGNRGVEVARLHTALQKSGFSIPDAETPGKDGETINDTRFGEITASKVSEFQEKYRSEILTLAGLSSPTGYVGGRTRAKLNQLYRCNQTPTPLPTNPTPTLPVACTMDAMLCPDGKTYVGRTGPSCQFAACPTTSSNNNIKPVLNVSTENSWVAGNTATIKWETSNASSNSYVGRINLYKGANFLAGIVPVTSKLPTSGSIQWQVPSNSVTGSDFKIQAILYTGGYGNESEVASDWSEVFSINPRPQTTTENTNNTSSSIKVMSPSGVNLIQGQETTITWYSDPSYLNSLVGLDLYQNDNFVLNIASISTNGYYNWEVPTNFSGSGFKIRAVLLNAKEGNYSYSTLPFSIQAQ